jgi:RNA polymerase sigma-70 factor (ECF subfamily)
MSDTDNILLQKAAAGDEEAFRGLVSPYLERLLKMVRLRMDRRLGGRVDADDIVQETLLEAHRRLTGGMGVCEGNFYLWLRQLACQKLIDAQRYHLGADKRSAAMEVSLYRGPMPEATSAVLAAQLLGRLTSPSQATLRAELQLRVQEFLNAMDPMDREILVLRHFEHLSNAEIAECLNLSRSAASKRYVVALGKLRQVLEGLTDFTS